MNKKILISLALIFALSTAGASAEYNKYNEENYINSSNQTLEEVVSSMGISFEDFKAEYGLPEDMPADTNETAAYYHLSVKNFAKLAGTNADEVITELKDVIGEDCEITEDMMWGDIEKKIPLSEYLADYTDPETNLTAIYFGEDMPLDTPLSEVREELFRKILADSSILSYFEEDDLLVMLKGKYMDFDVAPVIINDRTMVPLRSIFEALGASVNWDGETKTIFANTEDKIIIMQVGQSNMFVNEDNIQLDSPAVIVEDRTLVPLRAIAEAMDTQVFYNDVTKTVVIH